MRAKLSEENPNPWVNAKYNIFPKSRQRCLEEKLLNNLGMTQIIIRERDLLFFYQLLLPLCDTPLSGIREDKLHLYYYKVDKWSNIYAY